MASEAAKKKPGRPAGKLNSIPGRATGLIQLRLPKEDHAALMMAARRGGKTLTGWMREAAQETLLLAEEKRFSTRLRVVEDAAERAAKGVAKSENRIENLFAQAAKIEQAAIARDADLGAQVAALVTTLEAEWTDLRMALMILVALLHSTSPEHRKWLLDAHQKGHSAGKLYRWLLEKTD